MTFRFIRHAAPFLLSPALLLPALLLLAGCATTGESFEEGEEPVYLGEPAATQEGQAAQPEESTRAEEAAPTGEEGEVPISVIESEPSTGAKPGKMTEVLVENRVKERHELIGDHVEEAKALLRDVQLEYAFTGKGRSELLRGRPVAFALWSEVKQEWVIAHIEIPRPPIKWKPGGRPLPFLVRTPGIQARHIKGTGAERLTFAFFRDGEPLKVYGRKFPVFDNDLLKKKQWRAVVNTARPIVYLPFNEDVFDPQFVSGGKEYLLGTARKAIEELRLANAPSAAFPGESLADVVPAEVITTLAVIEQTDDRDFVADQQEAVNEVLSHYGLKREEAFRYSVSTAAALGPMQFTNRKNNGTYAMVVRRCPAAKLDPMFERGATNLLNAMKAAICLFDLDLSNMRSDIVRAYRENKQVLGIFPVASYNGGAKNVGKLYNVLKRMKVKLEELRLPGLAPPGKKVTCPCLWKAAVSSVTPLPIPKYNNENRWYIEKYQSILRVFE